MTVWLPEERTSIFAGHQINTPWDPLHRAYFNGHRSGITTFRIDAEIAAAVSGSSTQARSVIGEDPSVSLSCSVRHWAA
jgi:hypothetical protein